MVSATCIQPLLDLQCGVVSALPVQDRVDDCAFPAHDDFVERCTQDPLARRNCRGRMRPSSLEIDAKLHQPLPLLLAQRRRPAREYVSDLAFYFVDGLQCLVPAALQLASHQAIGRIDGVVLPTGMRDLVARLLKR